MNERRVGYGIRHPDLEALLQTLTPATSQLANWGELRLRISAYLTEHRVHDPLVTSVRCLVEVDGRIIVTESPDDVLCCCTEVNLVPGHGYGTHRRGSHAPLFGLARVGGRTG